MGQRSNKCSRTCGRVCFFGLWLLLWLASIALLLWNVKWHVASISEKIMAVAIVVGLALLLVDVMEGMAMAILTICLFGRPRKERTGDSSRITAILNYNLLAYCKKDVDDCYERMYQAFLGNISENISAVLVSVTPAADLKRYEMESRDRYRGFLYNTLKHEGKAYVKNDTDDIEYVRLVNLWQKAETKYGRRYLKSNLEKFCRKICREFMCIHRVSKVLRKCGQYQDLMLLGDGYKGAYTYCDRRLYGPYARKHGEPMFYETDDVRNIYGRKFDYTFVLDGDTRIQPGVAHSLLNIAVMKPEKGIIQPAIKFEVTIWDTIYMHLEDLRSQLNEPMANCMPRILGQCGFYGKALLNNRIYIDSIIGHPRQLLEKVPVNVLSHDTYEAAILKPYYVANVSFVERPVYNYLAWNSRLRRWNLGDLILLMYFSKCFGAMMRPMQKFLNKENYFRVRVRTEIKLDFVTYYICHAPIRAIFVKPFWCVFVIVYTAALGTRLYYPWVPIIVVLIIICIFSKIPLLLRCSKALIYIIPELLSSMIQFTAEIIVGFVRIIRVFYALTAGKQVWIPQRYVEEEFDTVNVWKIWVYSWKHLWGYALFGLLLIAMMIVLAIFGIIVPLIYILIIFDLATIAAIPMYCFITSLRICPCCHSKKEKEKSSLEPSPPSTIDSGFRDVKDIAPLIDVEDEKPRKHVTKHETVWIDNPEPVEYTEEYTIIDPGVRHHTERTGTESAYEEILVPIEESNTSTTYQLFESGQDFDIQSLKRKPKPQRQVETYEEILSQLEEKDNPIYRDAEDNEYVLINETSPSVTQTVYRVDEAPRRQEHVYEKTQEYNQKSAVYQELETAAEERKAAELREALRSLDSAISSAKTESRVETDGASTRYIRTKKAHTQQRSPVNIIDQKIAHKFETESKLASGFGRDADFSEYITIPERSSGYNSEAPSSRYTQKSSYGRENSNAASVEVWSDKGTLSSAVTESTLLDKDEPLYEDMDVQSWLRENQPKTIQRESSHTYESIPMQSKSYQTRVIEKTSANVHENKPIRSYFEKYGPSGVHSKVTEQTITSSSAVPVQSMETSRIVTRDSRDYENVGYGTTSPTTVVQDKKFTYGKLDDKVMSEGTLINHKLYENLSEWHKAMDKTMTAEKPIEESKVSVTERTARMPAPQPRMDSLSYKTHRAFNLGSSERRDVRREVIEEEPTSISTFSNVSAAADSYGDEFWSNKYSKTVTKDEVEPSREQSYEVVTEQRAVSPRQLVVTPPRKEEAVFVKKLVTEERAVSPERLVSVKRSVSPTKQVIERAVSPERLVSVERAPSPQKVIAIERSVSPERVFEVERPPSPETLISFESSESERMVSDGRSRSPQRLISVTRSASPERVYMKRSVSPAKHTVERTITSERTADVERSSPERLYIKRSVSPTKHTVEQTISSERTADVEMSPERVYVKRSMSPTKHVVEQTISSERTADVSSKRQVSEDTREVVTERIGSPTRMVSREVVVTENERPLSPRSHRVERERHSSESDGESVHYVKRGGKTYAVTKRVVSPQTVQGDSDEYVVKTRETRTFSEPTPTREEHMERSYNRVSEKSSSSFDTDREDFDRADELRGKTKERERSAFKSVHKAQIRAVEITQKKGKKHRKELITGKLSASRLRKTDDDSTGEELDDLDIRGSDGEVVEGQKEKWLLKYEKRLERKESRRDKHSKDAFDGVGSAFSGMKDSVAGKMDQGKDFAGKAFRGMKDRGEGLKDSVVDGGGRAYRGARDKAAGLRDHADGLLDKGKGYSHDAYGGAKDFARDKAGRVKDGAEHVVNEGKESSGKAYRSTKEKARRVGGDYFA